MTIIFLKVSHFTMVHFNSRPPNVGVGGSYGRPYPFSPALPLSLSLSHWLATWLFVDQFATQTKCLNHIAKWPTTRSTDAASPSTTPDLALDHLLIPPSFMTWGSSMHDCNTDYWFKKGTRRRCRMLGTHKGVSLAFSLAWPTDLHQIRAELRLTEDIKSPHSRTSVCGVPLCQVDHWTLAPRFLHLFVVSNSFGEPP